MVSGLLVFGAIATVFLAMHVRLIQRYSRTKDKRSLYFGIACILWAITAVLGVLLNVVDALGHLSLAMLINQILSTLGVLGFLFANVFAIAMAKPDEKTRGIWASLIPFLVITSIIWAFDPIPGGVIDGVREFTLTSMYKAPYGLPVIEAIITSMAMMAAYPTYLFFRISKNTREKLIKKKSFLMGTGFIIATIAYSIEVTGGVPPEYTTIADICRLMIFVGCFILFFGYMMPKRIERMLVGGAIMSEESVRTFVEEFFVHPVAPSTGAQPHAFSKNLGLNHQQMVGRIILLEFDPASHYEKAIQDFATEALANLEPIVIFTRKGSAIYSPLSQQKAVKFFCLTQQVSVPKEFSENEMLLPSNDTSLMLDIFDKTLKAHPQGNINVVFDSLSDLVLSIDFEKTYRFMRYAIEMLASPRNTVVFLLNQTAHDPKVESSLKSLFSNQIFFGKDGIKTVKLPEVQLSTAEKGRVLIKGG